MSSARFVESDPMPISDSITVAVAARNEESGLTNSVTILIDALRRHFDQYEVIVYDDGSTDGTGQIAEDLATHFDHVEVVHHQQPQGLGGVIRAGLERARMHYFIWIDGKGATTASALDQIFALRGQADLVIPYPTNQWERPLFRRMISHTFHASLNLFFRLKLHYYTHLVLSKVAEARRYQSRSGSHAAQAEMLVRMLRAGHTYVEVGVEDNFDFKWHQTKAFHPRNVGTVVSLLVRLAWDIYVRREANRDPIAGHRASTLPDDKLSSTLP